MRVVVVPPTFLILVLGISAAVKEHLDTLAIPEHNG
jgi:hypothetical protein